MLAHRVDLAQWRSISNKLRAEAIEVTEENIGDFSLSLHACVYAQFKVVEAIARPTTSTRKRATRQSIPWCDDGRTIEGRLT